TFKEPGQGANPLLATRSAESASVGRALPQVFPVGAPSGKGAAGSSRRPPRRHRASRKSIAPGGRNLSFRRPDLLAAPASSAFSMATSGEKVILTEQHLIPFQS